MELEWLLLPFTELELSGDTTLWLPPPLFLKPLRRKLNDKEGDLIIPLDALLGMGISLEGETTDGWNDLGEDGGRSISSVTITIAIVLPFFSGRDQFVFLWQARRRAVNIAPDEPFNAFVYQLPFA